MFKKLCLAGGVLALCGTTLAIYAQPPRGERGGNAGGGGVDAAVARLMDFDADKDGQLTKEELHDERLTALFQRADSNSDGVVTKDELTAQFTKDAAALGPNRGPGGFGPGGPPPGGPGFGGPGGFGPPAPGQILPPFLQDQLDLSEKQRQQLSDLQKDVDGKLAQILTREQMQQLREMSNRGPRGPGGNRGPGGPGGPPNDGGRPQRPPQ